MAGVRFTIGADSSQLTAGLDAASAKVQNWAGTSGASVDVLKGRVTDLGLSITALKGQLAELATAEGGGLQLAQQDIAIRAQLTQQVQSLMVAKGQLATATLAERAALQGTTNAMMEQTAAVGDLTIGNVNLESMMTRVVLRMAIMYAAVRPLISGIQELVQEHQAWTAAGDRLDAMLASQGKSVSVSSDQVKQYALSLAAAGRNSAPDILTAFDAILQRTHDVNQAFQLTSAAEELSAISGQKVAQSAKLIADAIESGTVKQLQEEGLQFSGLEAEIFKASDTGDRFLELQGKISAGLVDANGNLTTHVSTWNSFKTALENAWAAMGRFLSGGPGGGAPADQFGGVSSQTFNSPTATPEERAAYLAGYQRQLAGQEDAHFGRQASGDAFAANQPKVDQGVADSWQKLADQITRAGDAGDATKQKIDSVRDSFDGLRVRLDTTISSLEKVTGRSDEQNTVLAAAKKALDDLPYQQKAAEANVYAEAAEKAGDKQAAFQQQVNAAIEKNAGLVDRATQSATDYLAQVTKFGEVDQYLSPEAAALQKITDQYTTLSAAGDKRVAQIEKEQASLNQLDPEYQQQNQYLEDEKQKILLSQAALEGIEATKERAYADDYLAKLAQKDVMALVALGTTSADVQLKIAQLFGGAGISNQLGADVAALLRNAQLAINSNNSDTQSQLDAARGVMSPDDFAAFEAQLLAASKLYNDQVLAGVKNATGVLDQQGQLAAQHWGQVLQQAAQDGAALFDGLLAGSTTGLESSLNSIFKNVTKNAGVDLENSIVVALGGSPNPKAYATPEDYQAAVKAQGAGGGDNSVNLAVGKIANLIGSAYGAYNTFQQISQPGTSIGQGAIAGLSAGASLGTAIYAGIGTVIGAIVGAIAGGIAAAVSPSKGSQDQYLVPEYAAGDSRGWFAETSQNLNQAAVKQYLDQLQATMAALNNGFIGIIAKFPGDLLAAGLAVLQGERFTGGEAAIGGDQWGTIGSAPSQHSMQQLQTYISSGLPQEIFGDFRNLLTQGFQNMGFSSAGANALIDQAQKMDPKDAITFLSTIQQAIQEFNDTIPKLSGGFLPSGGTSSMFSGGGDSIWAQAWTQTNETFAASLADSQKQMLELAATIPLLSGQDQANAIKQLADLNVQRYQAEIQFAQQLQAAALSMNRSFEADIRGKTVAGMKDANGKPDYGAQESYLQGYLANLEGQASKATTIDQLNYLQAQIQQTIDQMVSIADQSGNPAMASQYDKWGISALGQAETFLDAQFQRLGTGLDDLNSQLNTAEADFIQALKDGTLALNNFSGSGTGNNTGTGTGAGGGPGGGGSQGPGSSGAGMPPHDNPRGNFDPTLGLGPEPLPGGGGDGGTPTTPRYLSVPTDPSLYSAAARSMNDIPGLIAAATKASHDDTAALAAAIKSSQTDPALVAVLQNLAAATKAGGGDLTFYLTVNPPTQDAYTQALKLTRQ